MASVHVHVHVTDDSRQRPHLLTPSSVPDIASPSLYDYGITLCLCSVFETYTVRTLKSASADTVDDENAPALPTPVGPAATASAKKESATSTSSTLQSIEQLLETRSHFTCLVTRRAAKQSEVITRLQQV